MCVHVIVCASVYYRLLLAAGAPNARRRGDWFDRLVCAYCVCVVVLRNA
jgi:hypothetical protein